MIRHRISIAGLMALVAIIALGILGLKEGTSTWASGTFTMTVLLLLGSILSAVYGRGIRRATWLGFALFGWTYLIGTIGPLSGTGLKVPPMVFNSVLDNLHPWIHAAPQYIPNPQYTGGSFIFPSNAFITPTIIKPGTTFWHGDETSYHQVGHCLGALLFGCLGAFWSRLAYARRDRPVVEPEGT